MHLASQLNLVLDASPIHEENRMGLTERREVEKFKSVRFPEWKKEIDAASGFDVTLDIDWKALAVTDYADSYDSFFPKCTSSRWCPR
jgi:hypothetical protein